MNREYISKIDFLIEDEYEAIEGYNKVIDFFDASAVGQSGLIIKQLEHIKAEEEEHVRELTELKKMLEDDSYVPKLDILEEDLKEKKFDFDDALKVARKDYEIGISSAMELLRDTYGFDTSYYFDHIDSLDDVDASGVDEETGESYSNANIYYRDKQFEKLGISDLMTKAYDAVWSEDETPSDDGLEYLE